MGRRTDACAGRENQAYRDAWDAHDAAHDVWEAHCHTLLNNAAETLIALPEDEDERAAILADLGLPEPPLPPTLSCTLGDPVWCARCRARIRAALVDIGDLAALLESWADGHRGAASGEHIPTRRANAPSPSPITDTLDELYSAIAKVEADWREASGHPSRPNRARTGDARQRTLAYLHEQLNAILEHPGSVPFGRGVLAWQVRLQKLTKTDPVVRRRPGRCPRCQLVSVLQTRDDGYTECRSCGRLLSEKEYERDVVGGADAGVVAESRAGRQAS